MGRPFSFYSATTKDDSGRRIPLGVYIPNQLASEQPQVLGNGWAVGRGASDLPASHWAERGNFVLTYDNVRRGNVNPNPRGQKTETLAAVARAALALFGKKPHIRAYSEGTIHASAVAAEEPDLIDQITLYLPYGFEPSTPLGLMLRVEKEATQLPKPNAALARAAFLGALYAGVNPNLTLREIVALAPIDVRPDLCKALANGVRVSGVAGERDKISRPEPIRRELGALGISSVTIPTATHLDYLFDARVAAAGDQLDTH